MTLYCPAGKAKNAYKYHIEVYYSAIYAKSQMSDAD